MGAPINGLEPRTFGLQLEDKSGFWGATGEHKSLTGLVGLPGFAPAPRHHAVFWLVVSN
jgi:hypothetical protein